MQIGHKEREVQEASEAAAGDLFRQLNARLFIRFGEAVVGKRRLRKPASGVVTFGAAQLPIDIYAGPTTRGMIKEATTNADNDPASAGGSKHNGPGQEGAWLGNVSRGDRIRTCDLVVPNHAL
jgi:hypothetical protein